MIRYLMIYISICGLVGIIGMNRKLGFWGYFLASVFVSPLGGLVMIAVSDSKYTPRRGSLVTVDEQGSMNYAYHQAVRQYKQRIAQLVASRKITEEYAQRELMPLVRQLRTSLRYSPMGRPYSPLDPVLSALDHLPTPPLEGQASPAEGARDEA